MKKQLIFLPLIFIGILGISWQNAPEIQIQKFSKTIRHNSGSPTAKTGAPGEGNCTVCHIGTVQDGSIENQFILVNSSGAVTNYVPGETYQISLFLASNPSKKGFQATVLDATNTFAGTFTPAAGGVNFTNSGSRFYANHTAASTNGSTFPLWDWQWTAPVTDVGPVTFYVATNVANNNAQNTGDAIYLSNYTINGTVGLENKQMATLTDFTASFSAENHSINIAFSTLINGNKVVNLVDLNGKSVLNMNLGTSAIGLNQEKFRVPDHIKNGMYIVQFFVDNHPKSQMVSIQR
ncbi:MAG: choice-of-anchor V domain-containing protein [Crocinitomicaceae bacterium]